jgi:tripeptide aminopeptidase
MTAVQSPALLIGSFMSTTQSESPIWTDSTLVKRAVAVGAAFSDRVLELASDIARIPAPTGDERARAARVAGLFEGHGTGEVCIDDIHNVVARHPGSERSRSVLLAAHTDTVFVHGTDLTVRHEKGRWLGPGLGDNSLGVAAVVLLPRMLAEFGIQPSTDLLLTGNVGEEGLGNLIGINRILDDYSDIGAMVAVEGQNLGRITHIAVGSVRLRVTVTGPGGHSWGDFGNPNAIHAAAQLVASLAAIPLTQTPKTTLSVGMISGGISINSIAPVATFDVDMRSTDPGALKRVVDRAHATLYGRKFDQIEVTHEVLGDRPAGQVAIGSRIVVSAAEILRSLNCSPAADASSTDANAAIARGIPAVCIGLTSGGNAHRLDEFIDLGPVKTGLAQLLLLALAVSSDLASDLLP